MAGSESRTDGATDDDGGAFVFNSVPASSAGDGNPVRDFFFGESDDSNSDTGDTGTKRRGRKPGSKNRARTLDETAPAVGSDRDIGEDVKDTIRAASKSAAKMFGPQLGQVWELDRTEVSLLASPATRLIKQTSNTSAASSPKWTAIMLAGVAALIGLPRVLITMQVLKLQRQQLAQPARTQSGGPQVQQQPRPQHGFDPISSLFPSDDEA